MEIGKQATNVCKGMAVVMLLVHHLWYNEVPGSMPFGIIGIAMRCKICVAMFIFLSGFGLARTDCSYKSIIKKRLPRLLSAYWLVAAVFIPIGIALYGMTFKAAYPSGNVMLVILQVLGLNVIEPLGGFNPTWWYMDVIVPIYLLSPVIISVVERLGIMAVVVFGMFFDCGLVFVPWIAPFAFGIYLSRERMLEKFCGHLGEQGMAAVPLLTFMAFCCRGGVASAELSDMFVAALFLLSSALLVDKFGTWLWPLKFIGRHSLNIFLLHTFLLVWFKQELKSFSPIVALLLLTIGSLIFSVAMEIVKSIAGSVTGEVYGIFRRVRDK